MTDHVWYNDLSGFMTYENYSIVLPSQDMSFDNKLNALVRFALYLGVFLALVRNDYRYLFLGIVAALSTYVINVYGKNNKASNQKFLQKRKLDIVDNKVCSRSTVDNPFMNPSISDIALNPTHPVACDVDRDDVKQTMENNFNARQFRDSSDL